MNTIPRMDDSLICRLLNVRIIGAGRLPKEDLQTIDDAIEAIKAATQPNEAEKLMDAAGLCRRCAAPVTDAPIDMVLHCPACGMQHVDAPSPTDGQNLRMWSNPPHKSHLCRPEDGGCGHIWRPADVPTNGVAAIKTKGKADSRQPAVTRPQPVGYATERDISLMADGGRGALVWAKALENDSIPLYTSPPKAAPLTDEQREVLAYLDGTGPLDGIWFGDKHPTEQGAYWWRKRLWAAFGAPATVEKERE